jgi:hypothetical protein
MRGARIGMSCEADFAANIWILARNSTLQTARVRVIARCGVLFSASLNHPCTLSASLAVRQYCLRFAFAFTNDLEAESSAGVFA